MKLIDILIKCWILATCIGLLATITVLFGEWWLRKEYNGYLLVFIIGLVLSTILGIVIYFTTRY